METLNQYIVANNAIESLLSGPINELTLTAYFKGKFMYDLTRQIMFVFDDKSKIWRADTDEFILTKTIIRHELIELEPCVLKYIDNPKQRLATIEDLRKWQTDAKLKHVVNSLKIETAVPYSDIESKNKDFIHCKNGISINIRTLDVENTTRDLIPIKCANTVYDPKAECPAWQNFLSEVFADDEQKIEFIQRWLGYSLLPENPEQKCLIATGEGCNGKSVLFGVIADIMADYCRQPLFSVFEQSESANDTGNPQRLNIIDARMIFVSETQNYSVLNTSLIKQMTGDDVISGRYLFSNNVIEFKIGGKITFITNHLPAIHDDSNAIWRRLLILRFNQSFVDRQKPNLKQELLKESAGIFNWLINGLIKYYNLGLLITDECKKELQEYQMESNNWLMFVNENCDFIPGLSTKIKDLYNAYETYCDENNVTPISKIRFVRCLINRFKLNKIRSGHDREWLLSGIKMKLNSADNS